MVVLPAVAQLPQVLGPLLWQVLVGAWRGVLPPLLPGYWGLRVAVWREEE